MPSIWAESAVDTILRLAGRMVYRNLLLILILFSLSELAIIGIAAQEGLQSVTSIVVMKESFSCGKSTCYDYILLDGQVFRTNEQMFLLLQEQQCVRVNFYDGHLWYKHRSYTEELILLPPQSCAS